MAAPRALIQHTTIPYTSRALQIGTSKTTEPARLDGKHAGVEQFDLGIQKMAFDLVKADANAEIEMDQTQAWIRIKGIERPFFHYQLYAAFWMLLKERGQRRGCIEADSMGLGKTCTAFLYIILNSYLVANAQHVREHPEQHLQPTRPGFCPQASDGLCPMSDKFPLQCACQEHSVARLLGVREGASLIFVPASLLDNWVAEWDALKVDYRSAVGLYVHHRDYENRTISSSDWHHLQLDTIGKATSSARLFLKDSCMAHRFIVLTTLESYDRWVASYHGNMTRSRTVPNEEKHRRPNDRLAWARVVLDESQLHVNFETEAFSIFQSLMNNGWMKPNFVALTGTPMLRNGVRDMIPVVNIINMASPLLDLCPEYSELTQPKYLEGLAHRYDVLVRDSQVESDREARRDLVRDVGKLLKLYCIRRHSNSVQNGKPLAYIPPLERVDVMCPATKVGHYLEDVRGMLKNSRSRDWLSKLADWERTGQQAGDFLCTTDLLLDNVQLCRVVSSVPALARYDSRRHLSWSYIREQNWHQEVESSPFFSGLALLEASSGKLRTLLEILTQLSTCRTWDGAREKCVVVSEFPIVCHIVACICHKHGIPYRWIHAAMPTAVRASLVRDFQDQSANSNPGEHPHGFRVLIGTSRLIGQGLTLHRAHRVILMEPSYHAGIEAQNADRVHRLGSMTDRAWAYRLINPDSELERMLVLQQEIQRKFHHDVERVNWGEDGATPQDR